MDVEGIDEAAKVLAQNLFNRPRNYRIPVGGNEDEAPSKWQEMLFNESREPFAGP